MFENDLTQHLTVPSNKLAQGVPKENGPFFIGLQKRVKDSAPIRSDVVRNAMKTADYEFVHGDAQWGIAYFHERQKVILVAKMCNVQCKFHHPRREQ